MKGIERFLGALETQTQELMETSSGQAKYEHQHRAIVWRIPRLPKPGQGSYTNHEFVCKLQLTSFDQVDIKFFSGGRWFESSFVVCVAFKIPSISVARPFFRAETWLSGAN